MWQELQVDDDLTTFAEIMRSMNEGYEGKTNLHRDLKAILLRKPDAHAYYYSDGKDEVVFAISAKETLPDKEKWGYKILMAGHRGENPALGMEILSAKIAELLEEKELPFYAIIAEVNYRSGQDFYDAIPAGCEKAGIVQEKKGETPPETIETDASYRLWYFTLDGKTASLDANIRAG